MLSIKARHITCFGKQGRLTDNPGPAVQRTGRGSRCSIPTAAAGRRGNTAATATAVSPCRLADEPRRLADRNLFLPGKFKPWFKAMTAETCQP